MDRAGFETMGTPLSAVSSGKQVEILRFQAGRGLQARLASMGILPGVGVRVVRNDSFGPLVLGLKGTRLMLGRGVADRVLVRQSDLE